ncbi:MAG: OmpA family protein [Candidatus Kapabacteria bacterium]|nr:OmpA family protein [Candidatus Kapabacteria bacterium]
MQTLFFEHPDGWYSVDSLNDPVYSRWYSQGALHIRSLTQQQVDAYTLQALDAEKPYQVSMSCIVDTASVGGIGIHITGQRLKMVFRITGQQSYAATVTDVLTSQSALLSSPGPLGQQERPCTAIAPNGNLNKLVVRVSGDTVTFSINDSIVERWKNNQYLKDIRRPIRTMGFTTHRQVQGKIHSFEVEYNRRPIPDVPEAFSGVTKTYVPELNNRLSSRYPVFTPNGERMYLVQSPRGPYTDDDVAYADAITDSTWTASELIGYPINNQASNNVIAVSQDGNELFLYGQYSRNGVPSGLGVSTSRRLAEGWSIPTNVTIEDYRNSANTHEETASPDRSVLILSADRSGETYGKKDLYVCFRQPDGTFSRPLNLGPDVNSSDDEATPFLAADGRTLYFASNSPGTGYGEFDIYVTKRLDSSWTMWTPRINLGARINTANSELYFTIHPSGKYAYVNTSSKGKNGIVRMGIPQDDATLPLLPDAVVVLSGRVTNKRTGQPLSATIRYSNLRTGAELGSAISNPKDGRYSLVLPGGKAYGMYVTLDGYLPISDNVFVDTLRSYTPVTRNLEMEPLDVGATIVLQNIFFDSDASILRPESRSELDRLAQLLQQRPTITVEIRGHTDDRGSADHNEKLSMARAESVRSYLIQRGIMESRLSAKGLGKSQPASKGSSDADRQKNRRVEFSISSM